MTGIFDFVLWVIPLSVELDFAGVVEDVLKETLIKNESKNFLAWFEKTGNSERFMDYDMDDLDDLFSDFHSLDHAHHHKVFSGKAYRILYQFDGLFTGSHNFTKMNSFVFERDFRTLRKYVPSIMEYMARFYIESTGISKGIYRLKEE